MTRQFSAEVSAFRLKCEERLRVTAQVAVQETISIAQRVGPSVGNPDVQNEGGRMPVVTGFLRASLQGAVGSMPSGPSANPGGAEYPVGAQVAGEPVSVALLRWNPNTGEPFFAGWTANYARYMEAYYGFLRGATELWDQTVEEAATQVKKGLG